MTTENQIAGGSNRSKSSPYLGIAPITPDVSVSLTSDITVCPDPKECPIQEAASSSGPVIAADVAVCPDPKECPIQEVTSERNAA